MPLEEQIANLTKVVEQGFAGLLASLADKKQEAPATVEVAAPTEPEAIPEKLNGKGPSFEEVIAIAHKLAGERGPAVAAKLIQQHGAEKLALMDKSKYPAFVAAASVMLEQRPDL